MDSLFVIQHQHVMREPCEVLNLRYSTKFSRIIYGIFGSRSGRPCGVHSLTSLRRRLTGSALTFGKAFPCNQKRFKIWMT